MTAHEDAHEAALEAATRKMMPQYGYPGAYEDVSLREPMEHNRQVVEHYLSAMEAAGRKMVPREATEEMGRTGAMLRAPDGKNFRTTTEIWAAMWDDAPPEQEV